MSGAWGVPQPQLVVQEGITGPLVIDARVQRVLEKFQEQIAKLAGGIVAATDASSVAVEELKAVIHSVAKEQSKQLIYGSGLQNQLTQDVITASERRLQMQIKAIETELVTQLDQRYLSLSQVIEDAVRRVSSQSLVHYEALEGNLGMVTAQLMKRIDQHQQHLLDVLKADRDNTPWRRFIRFLRRPPW